MKKNFCFVVILSLFLSGLMEEFLTARFERFFSVPDGRQGLSAWSAKTVLRSTNRSLWKWGRSFRYSLSNFSFVVFKAFGSVLILQASYSVLRTVRRKPLLEACPLQKGYSLLFAVT